MTHTHTSKYTSSTETKYNPNTQTHTHTSSRYLHTIDTSNDNTIQTHTHLEDAHTQIWTPRMHECCSNTNTHTESGNVRKNNTHLTSQSPHKHTHSLNTHIRMRWADLFLFLLSPSSSCGGWGASHTCTEGAMLCAWVWANTAEEGDVTHTTHSGGMGCVCGVHVSQCDCVCCVACYLRETGALMSTTHNTQQPNLLLSSPLPLSFSSPPPPLWR